MGNVGYFLPILVVFFVSVVLLLGLIDKWTQAKGSYYKWLEQKLERDPGYIDWLRTANDGRDYKVGLRILGRQEREYMKWRKKMIEGGHHYV